MPNLTLSSRIRQTPFTSRVEQCGVKSYTVYNKMLLPTVFRSIEEDYWHLCQHVQVWDVSAERQVQIKGKDAARLVQLMTPRDLSKAQDDQCFYVPLCDENGKLINDPIAIHHSTDCWWLSIADSDALLWAKGLATGFGFDVEVSEPDVWPIAIQGPKAEQLMSRLFGDVVHEIRFFRFKRLPYRGHEFLVARSGWSKQGGFEIYIDDAELGVSLWDELFELGQDLEVGPGCPNLIERIEGGLLSFGNDMDFRHTPLQCGLNKYCQLDKQLDSLSIQALQQQAEHGVPSRLIGLMAEQQNIVVADKSVFNGDQKVGEITSDCWSPRYQSYLAFAMLDTNSIDRVLASQGNGLHISAQGKNVPVKCCELPFDF